MEAEEVPDHAHPRRCSRGGSRCGEARQDAGRGAVRRAIRHPRYVEIAFATFGYAAISNYLGCWILAILTIPVIHAIVILEERELMDRFGDSYRDYAARVPRYFPKRQA